MFNFADMFRRTEDLILPVVILGAVAEKYTPFLIIFGKTASPPDKREPGQSCFDGNLMDNS